MYKDVCQSLQHSCKCQWDIPETTHESRDIERYQAQANKAEICNGAKRTLIGLSNFVVSYAHLVAGIRDKQNWRKAKT